MNTDLGRRAFLGVAAGTICGAPRARARAAAAASSGLAVFDSRLADSRRFAERAAGDGFRLFDIAGQDGALWRDARAGFRLGPDETAIGLTRWSDWVNLRGLLGGRGLRVVGELRLDCGAAGIAHPYDAMPALGRIRTAPLRSGATGALFAWSMA